MTRRLLPLSVAALALAGPAACAGTDGRPSGAAAPTRADAGARDLATRARALVAGDPSALGFRVVVSGPRAGVRAQTDRDARTITLFVRSGETPHRVAHDLAHELGHAVDHRLLTDADRAAYLRRRGVSGAAWWPSGAGDDYDAGAGDFAEVFALCRAASPEFRGTLAPRPADPCPLLPAAARRAALTTEVPS